ncbi:hypothetical protein KKF84_04195 [Myxococcota bacterium]|nr:hypothetical protein [Myxococcota bacterium]MBU1534496.1 hypothetical protein [Myxococcota bacterium]
MVNDRLVAKGRNHSITTLAQLGRIAVGNASAHPDELDSFGWTSAQTEQLGSDIEALLATAAAKSEAKTNSKHLTETESVAKVQAKSLIRRVRKAIKLLSRDGDVESLASRDFSVGTELRTTPGIMMYLERIIPLVARLDSGMERFFQGQKASELLARAATALAEADTRQETARQSLPADTVAVYELKGRILDQVEELNTIASMAFDGQAHLRSKFNKDLLLRGINHRSPTPDSPTDPAQPTT